MTQSINALTWQEQSDATQPLANYSVNFATDLVWQFRLSTAMYHFQTIDPKGVTIDNSNGAGTITLQSAAFTVNILPYSREDIDLSNASQQLTLTYIGVQQTPPVAAYSVPIVFWIKKPSGAQQNQLAINQAVQSAIIATVLGNMQPIINAGFSEWPQGTSVSSTVAGAYTAEGWIMKGAALGVGVGAQQASPFTGFPVLGGFPTEFAYTASRAFFNADTTQVQIGAALTSADSKQFAGSQITLGMDLCVTNQQPGWSGVTITLLAGTGTDQNVFTPFTGQIILATASFPAINFTQRISLTTAGTIPANINQLGILITFTPAGVASANERVQLSRPQLDFGSIAQQFRAVPQLMERDRCLSFFEVLNSEGVANYVYSTGFSGTGTEVTTSFTYRKKRALPAFIFSSANTFVENHGNVGTGISCRNIGLDRALLALAVAGPITIDIPRLIQDNGAGASSITINARM